MKTILTKMKLVSTLCLVIGATQVHAAFEGKSGERAAVERQIESAKSAQRLDFERLLKGANDVNSLTEAFKHRNSENAEVISNVTGKTSISTLVTFVSNVRNRSNLSDAEKLDQLTARVAMLDGLKKIIDNDTLPDTEIKIIAEFMDSMGANLIYSNPSSDEAKAVDKLILIGSKVLNYPDVKRKGYVELMKNMTTKMTAGKNPDEALKESLSEEKLDALLKCLG